MKMWNKKVSDEIKMVQGFFLLNNHGPNLLLKLN